MSNDSQLEQMQSEWRAGVISKLDNLSSKIDNMPLIFAAQTELNAVKIALNTSNIKIDKLETFKNKLIGGILAFNTIVAVVTYLINHH